MENPIELTKLLENKHRSNDYDVICRAVNYKKMIDRFGDKDAYVDVHPYEETAVWLGDEKSKKNYINASRIQSPY